MKKIKESANAHHWPRKEYRTLDLRKRDLVIRISNWSRDKDEPAFDVEVYIGGVYDFDESKSCTRYRYGTMAKAKEAAISFSQEQIAKLL